MRALQHLLLPHQDLSRASSSSWICLPSGIYNVDSALQTAAEISNIWCSYQTHAPHRCSPVSMGFTLPGPNWSRSMASHQSCKELQLARTIFLALKAFSLQVQGKEYLVYTDNMSARAFINWQEGTRYRTKPKWCSSGLKEPSLHKNRTHSWATQCDYRLAQPKGEREDPESSYLFFSEQDIQTFDLGSICEPGEPSTTEILLYTFPLSTFC